jgi:SAM-dependent methyltransferase
VLALPRADRAGAVALDLACGQGRHAAALHRAGYAVVAMDVSMRALRHACANADTRGGILAVQADADAWPFAQGSFDLVVQVDFLDRRIFPLLGESLRRGGLLLIDTFLDRGHRNAEGPSRPEFLLSPSELPGAFPDFEILRYEETGDATSRAAFLGRKR